MGTDSGRDRLLPTATGIIRRRARSLVGQYGFTSSDVADIEHDLALDLLRRAVHFDSNEGTEIQFVMTVVKHGVATLVKQRRAIKRGADVLIVSFDEELDKDRGNGVTRHDIIDADSYLGITRGPDTPAARRRDVRLDLERALSTLPPDLRQLAEYLREMTPSEVARATGVPRTTINDRIKKLGAALRERGLEKC